MIPKESTMPKSENWLYTFFSDIPLEIDGALEHIYQLEVCATTGRKHYQGFIHYSSIVSRSKLLKQLSSNSIHLEIARNPEACRNYCRKLSTRYNAEAIKIDFVKT